METTQVFQPCTREDMELEMMAYRNLKTPFELDYSGTPADWYSDWLGEREKFADEIFSAITFSRIPVETVREGGPKCTGHTKVQLGRMVKSVAKLDELGVDLGGIDHVYLGTAEKYHGRGSSRHSLNYMERLAKRSVTAEKQREQRLANAVAAQERKREYYKQRYGSEDPMWPREGYFYLLKENPAEELNHMINAGFVVVDRDRYDIYVESAWDLGTPGAKQIVVPVTDFMENFHYAGNVDDLGVSEVRRLCGQRRKQFLTVA